MNSFFTVKQQAKCTFLFNGRTELIFTKFKDQSKLDSKNRLVSGLNHFLQFVFDRDKDTYEYICLYIYKIYYTLIKGHKDIESSVTYREDLIKLISDLCIIRDGRLLDTMVRYIVESSIDKIDPSKAETDLTLDKHMTTALDIVSVSVKFTHVISHMVKNGPTFPEILEMLVNEITTAVYKRYCLYVEKTEGSFISYNELDSRIDRFLLGISSKHWADFVQTREYNEKFMHIGIDQGIISRKNKAIVMASFKKYVPSVEPKERGFKYVDAEKEIAGVYWSPEKDHDDFKFVTLNMVSWIQATLRNVVKNQNTKLHFPQNFNKVDILTSANEETTATRDSSLYEDKELHLFEARKTSALSLIKKVVQEVEKYNLPLDMIRSFNINKTHYFNQYILSKIFLCLTGEERVYKELMGYYNKIFLALFYVKIKARPEFASFIRIMDLMFVNTKPNTDFYAIEDVEAKIEEYGLYSNVNAIRKIAGVYMSDNGGQPYELSLDVICNVINILDSPSNMRHILFPELYSPNESVPPLTSYTNCSMDYANDVKAYIVGEM